MKLYEQQNKSISCISGELIYVSNVFSASIGEIVYISTENNLVMEGEVLSIDKDTALIQVYGSARGISANTTTITFTNLLKQAPLSLKILNRSFDGSFAPIDNMPTYIPDKWASITGFPINPSARIPPEEFIETGISSIDGLNTLVKGQKLPIFSCAGLPSKEVAAMILSNSRLRDRNKKFAVVFAALGLTFYEFSFYIDIIKSMKTNYVTFINMADDPVLQRLLAPRYALTVSEYLAFDMGMDVLVLVTDMTNYCDALREISNAREELPGRRGYPGYLYSDLASIYERAGRISGVEGSITMIPILTMPEDDITHPIPDLTGYITEGQLVLSKELHGQGIFPPIDILPSLSRLMQQGIGEDRTRNDHRRITNGLYKFYAKGVNLRKLEAIVGREGVPADDQKLLEFATSFEAQFVNQHHERRTIIDTLEIGISLLDEYKLTY